MPPEPKPVCNAIGRTTRQYVTAYNLDRPQVVKARRGAKRCFVADFNGALPAGSTIATATWRCTSPNVMVMSDAVVYDGLRIAGVDVLLNYGGRGLLKCDIVTAAGAQYVATFDVTVTNALWFGDEAVLPAGPYTLVATG